MCPPSYDYQIPSLKLARHLLDPPADDLDSCKVPVEEELDWVLPIRVSLCYICWLRYLFHGHSFESAQKAIRIAPFMS